MSDIDDSLFDFSRSRSRKKQTLRICDKHGCEKDGLYPAPKSPHKLAEHYHFCLSHIREYNASWNYFSDFTDDAFADYLDSDRFGHRPTWSLGNIPHSDKKKKPKNLGDYFRNAFDDPFDLGKKIFDDPIAHQPSPIPTASDEVRKALNLFGLSLSDNFETVKLTYKRLVKKYHPDVNKNDPEAEKMLKNVLKAFEILEKYFI